MREEVREAWGWMWLERLGIDVRHAIRLWARNPGFSSVAVLTVAIGIGASTAIVGQINAVFWKPLPVSRPGDLRFIAWTSPRHPFVAGPNVLPGPRVGQADTFGSFSYLVYVAMRDGSRAFSDLACWSDLGEARPVVLGELGFGAVQFVSGNYFQTLGVPAALGRTIQPDDDHLGAWSPVAMISHRFWMRTFGGDATVTSQTLRLNGHAFSVIGVMPEGFFGMDPATSPDVVVPMGAVQVAAATVNPLLNRGIWNVCRTVGRLAPGVSDEAARQDAERWIADAIAAAPPPLAYDPPRVWLVDGSRGLGTLREAASTPLVVLFAVVSGLLLAACANIAGLLLARGNAREKEFATRLALGAPRARVIRQLITESLVLSSAGGVLGLAVAYALAGAAPRLLSQFMPTLYGADRTLSVSAAIDASVFAFGVAAALASGLLFGILPAFRVTRVSLMAVIRQSTTGAGRTRFGFSSGHAMVAAQTALAMVLLVGAGLFLRTVANLRAADLGFKAEGLLYARVEPRSGRLPVEQRQQFFEDAVRRLERVPGVTAASATAVAPMGGAANVGVEADFFHMCPPGHAESGLPPRGIRLNWVLPRYFETLGIAVISGREFGWNDNHPKNRGIVVNEAFATAYGHAAAGQTVRVGAGCEPRSLSDLQVVGVVADSRAGLRAAPGPALYFPLVGWGGPVTLMVRTAGDPAAMIATVRRAMRELNADIPTFSEATLVDLREQQLRRERLLSDLLLLFGTVTLLVCCLGIYGMLSYSVARKRAEISVRMAIGARTPDVVRLIVRESLVPVSIGIAIGCLAAIGLARWVDSLLFGVAGHDPWTMAIAAAVFLLVATAAAALPARSAARVDPVLALRT